MSVACNEIHQNVEGSTYFKPTHCRELLLKGTRNFVKRTGEGCNHLSGKNFFLDLGRSLDYHASGGMTFLPIHQHASIF